MLLDEASELNNFLFSRKNVDVCCKTFSILILVLKLTNFHGMFINAAINIEVDQLRAKCAWLIYSKAEKGIINCNNWWS